MDLRAYERGVTSDLQVLVWWLDLLHTGDLERVFAPSAQMLSQFFHLLRPPTRLWYLADPAWWACAWTAPLFSGGSYSLWVHPDRRQSPSGLAFIRATLDLALEQYPLLVNFTRDPLVAEKTAKLGYRYLGHVPFLFEGDAAHVLTMTRADYDARWRTAPESLDHGNGRES